MKNGISVGAERQKQQATHKLPGLWGALGAGLVGAAATTALHEGLRYTLADPPRLDRVGQRAFTRLVEALGGEPPKGNALYGASLAADVVTNALYYGAALRLARKRPWLAGAVAGTLAGAGAVTLPQRLGLGSATSKPLTEDKSAAAIAFALYLAGGMASAAAFRWFSRRSSPA